MHYLNLSPSEVKEACRNNLDFFASVAAPDIASEPFSDFHKVIWAEAIADRSFAKIAFAVPRGHAKTFLMKLFVLYSFCYLDEVFVLTVAASNALAQEIISDVADMFDSPNIQLIFGNWREGMEEDNNTQKVFSFQARTCIMRALGAGSSLRGISVKKRRPTLILMDDIQSKEDAESIEQGIKLLRWMTGTLLKSGDAKRLKVVFIGNMYPDVQDSQGRYACILRNLQRSKHWVSLIAGAIKIDGTALWPEVHSLDRLLEQLEEDLELGVVESFYSELMNDPSCGALNIGLDIRKLYQEAYSQDTCQGQYIIIDLATDKPTADQAEIVRYSYQSGLSVAVGRISGKFTPTEIIEKTLKECFDHGVTLVAVEDVNFQYAMLHFFTQALESLGATGISIVPVSPKGVRKNSRIGLMLQRLLKKEQAVSPELYPALVSQVTQWQPNKKDNLDDFLDNMAYCHQVEMEYATLISLPIQESQNYLGFEDPHHTFNNLCF